MDRRLPTIVEINFPCRISMRLYEYHISSIVFLMSGITIVPLTTCEIESLFHKNMVKTSNSSDKPNSQNGPLEKVQN